VRFGEEMDRCSVDYGLDRNWIPPALTGEAGRTWQPQVEMFEHDGELVVRAELPGLNKEDVKIELTDDGLTITANAGANMRKTAKVTIALNSAMALFRRRVTAARRCELG